MNTEPKTVPSKSLFFLPHSPEAMKTKPYMTDICCPSEKHRSNIMSRLVWEPRRELDTWHSCTYGALTSLVVIQQLGYGFPGDHLWCTGSSQQFMEKPVLLTRASEMEPRVLCCFRVLQCKLSGFLTPAQCKTWQFQFTVAWAITFHCLTFMPTWVLLSI